MRRPWTHPERKEALRLLNSGVPVREVAAKIGRTPAAVTVMRSRTEAETGVVGPRIRPCRSWPAPLVDAVATMTAKEIAAFAARTGRSVYAVRSARRRALGPPPPPATVRALALLRAEPGMTSATLADRLGKSRAVIRQMLHALCRKGKVEGWGKGAKRWYAVGLPEIG